MQASIKCALDQPPNTLPTYHFCYLESNNIGAEGCKHLSKAHWTNLHTLYLSIIYVI